MNEFRVSNIKVEKVDGYYPKMDEIKTSVGITSLKELGKMKVKGGLRDAFICPPGYVWLTGDYASEEIRLIANYSGETNYLEPIKKGYDIHNYIAKEMFGYEDPSHRTKVKILNFACNYGANEYTIAQRLNIDVPKAKELLDHFYKTMSQRLS